MKKLIPFFFCLAIVQSVFGANWTSYPVATQPGLSDTFLFGTTTTNKQISANNLGIWIRSQGTNGVIWTNAAVAGKAIVIVGIDSASGQPILAATNWPTGAGDMIGANNLLDVADVGLARTNIGAHNGANLTTGIIPAARLGTGGTGGKFLGDDSVFHLIPGGGDMLGANNGLDFASISTTRANLGADNASNLTLGTVAIARLPSLAIYTNLNALTNLIGGSNVTVTITVAADGAKSVTIQGITTPQFLTLALSLGMMTNGGGQLWTNTTFAANGLVYAGANKQLVAVNVGAGAVTNDGLGNFGAATLRDSTALANNSFAYSDSAGKIVSGYDGSSLSNLIGGPIVTSGGGITVTATRITTGGNAGSTNYSLLVVGGGGGALLSTNYFLGSTNAFVFDCALYQRADLGVLTNFNITITNAPYLTNTASQSFQINLHNPTNGPWAFQSLLSAGGLVLSNNANAYDTNWNAQTRIIGRLDWSRTNLEINVETNWLAKYSFTNSSQGGGGGGGGTAATDNFTRANADPLSSPMSDGSSTWSTSVGSYPGNLRISGNQATGHSGFGALSASKVASPSFAANQSCSITLTAAANVGCGVRMQSGSGAGYKLVPYSATRLAIYRVDDSGSIADTLLTFDDPGPTMGAGDVLTLTISGSTLTAKLNGVLDSAMTTTDSTYATGQPFILANDGSSISLFNATAP